MRIRSALKNWGYLKLRTQRLGTYNEFKNKGLRIIQMVNIIYIYCASTIVRPN